MHQRAKQQFTFSQHPHVATFDNLLSAILDFMSKDFNMISAWNWPGVNICPCEYSPQNLAAAGGCVRRCYFERGACTSSAQNPGIAFPPIFSFQESSSPHNRPLPSPHIVGKAGFSHCDLNNGKNQWEGIFF